MGGCRMRDASSLQRTDPGSAGDYDVWLRARHSEMLCLRFWRLRFLDFRFLFLALVWFGSGLFCSSLFCLVGFGSTVLYWYLHGADCRGSLDFFSFLLSETLDRGERELP